MIAIAWNGLPFYAARLIRAGIEAYGGAVTVLGTPPGVPIRGMEEALGRPVIWVDPKSAQSWSSLGLEVPEVMFQTGWVVRSFNRLSRAVKARHGKVVLFVDNIPRPDLRQAVGALYFRLRLRRRLDAVMVPGALGRRLLAKFGMPDQRVFGGMYGADPALFSPPPDGAPRKKEFLFVGQLIERKGVDLLLHAFVRLRRDHPDWRIRFIGSGPLRPHLGGAGVEVEDFLQPAELAFRYREAAYFVLPSREEHWGVVAHEAALSGCPLLLSDAVGSAPDLLDEGNGLRFRADSEEDLLAAMERAVGLDQGTRLQMSHISVGKAAAFGPKPWADSFLRILRYLGMPTARELA